MLESLFINSSLVMIGLPLLAAPIVIHMINLMRHRRVSWAAMEFVLVSQKKTRSWVLLKQMLLLLLRILAIAAILLILGKLLLDDRLLGGITTHHVILLDDSYSMSQSWDDTSAFDKAKQVIERIGDDAALSRSRQLMTVMRFSDPIHPDLQEEPVSAQMRASLGSKLEGLTPSQLATSPDQILEALERMLGTPDDEERIVYVLSDFRRREWDTPDALNAKLAEITEGGTKLELVQCASKVTPNLAIVNVSPRPGTRAAGVPLLVEVSVKNFGDVPAREVSVLLQEDGRARPGLVFDEIGPGRTETRRFLVHFPTAGDHRITASLEADSVLADNIRHLVINFPAGVPVLVVDGAPDAVDARFIGLAFSPGGSVRTGVDVQVELPRYLIANPLDKFATIYVANVERLETAAVEALEDYAKAGGGVIFLVGDQTRSKFVNDVLYRDGEGAFPVPLAGQLDLILDRLDASPDLQITEHPIFDVFAGERNTFINAVNIRRYFAVPADWVPAEHPDVRVVGELRNGAPLVIEQPYGDGRVMAFLTTAAPVWNNWARNPTFVVSMLELQAYMTRRKDAQYMVGNELKFRLNNADYGPNVEWARMDDNASSIRTKAALTSSAFEVKVEDTRLSGVYEARLETTDGKGEVRTFAYNVAPEEGELALLTPTDLAERVPSGGNIEITGEGAFQGRADEANRSNISELLLYALIVLLIGEQALAYSASYHPPVMKGARA